MKPKNSDASSAALKDKFAKAKAFINLEQYDKARAILKTIDHPTATKWLAQLDVIAPKKRQIPRIRIVAGCFILLLICIAFFALIPPRAPVAATQTSVAAAATNDAAAAFRTDIPAATLDVSVTPSATITDTFTPTPAPPTLSPAPTDAPSETWYTQRTANLRTCAKTTCDQIAQLDGGIPINIIGYEQGEMYKGSDIWRIVDYNGQRVYVHSSLVAVNAPQPTTQFVFPTVPAQIVQPPSNPGLVCPKNCDTAVALGWTAQQAGQCSNLNRDPEEDNEACYGN